MTATCSRVTSRPRVSALRMMGRRYRFKRGLELFPVNHSTPVMKITMDQDSISRRVRVRRGKNRRDRNTTMATTKVQNRPSRRHSWLGVGRNGISKRLGIARELDVGDDASVIDGYPGRRVIERRCQLDGAVPGQGNDGLHRALAESRASHELRTMVVFEGAGDDLRRRCRSTVDKYNDRRAIERVAGRRLHFELGFRRAPFSRHDDALADKLIGYRALALEHPPRS